MAEPFRLLELSARGFRNLERLQLELAPRFNVFSGPNGAGKSNLLEAVGLLCAARSFRGARMRAMLAAGARQGVLEGRAEARPLPEARRIGMEAPSRRKLLHEGKKPRSLAWWRARWPVVWFHPGSLQLSAGPPEVRRALLDGLLDLLDPVAAADRLAYERALRSRNRLLREGERDERALLAYERVLAERGPRLVAARRRLLEELAPRAERAFLAVMGESLPLKVSYEASAPPEPSAFLRSLTERRAHDARLRRTSLGPHADEVTIRLQGAGARGRASQGQHRAVALAFKVAEAALLAERLGRAPLLLLDDVSSELDPERNARLFALLASQGGQVLLTTTDPAFIRLQEEREDFRVEAGRILPA